MRNDPQWVAKSAKQYVGEQKWKNSKCSKQYVRQIEVEKLLIFQASIQANWSKEVSNKSQFSLK